MSEHEGRERRSRASWRWAWLGLALLIPLPGRGAAASPIQRLRMSRVAAASVTSRGSYWDRYFARALQMHSLRVQGPNALRVLSVAPAAQLSSSAFVDYLLWRRSLNPVRFDHYHPYLAPMLQQPQNSGTTLPATSVTPGVVIPPIAPTPVIPPTNPPDTPPTPPIPPSQVPEPSTILIASGMVVAAVAGRRWARANA